jgi:hypothetical protein
MQYFAAQYQPGQQTTRSLRASQYKQFKRKRDEDAEEGESSANEEADVPGPLVSSNTQSYASSHSLEAAQLRVAGLLPEDAAEIPPKPFPHAPVRTSREDSDSATRGQKGLAELDPVLYAVNTDQRNDAPELRQTRLGVLTAIMHRYLLEGNYDRAGRAWGMILRSQIAGSPVDVRNHGRWGIGAEILLRKNSQRQLNNSRNSQGSIPDEQSASNKDSIYTEEGFELAREYYERLIVQYPNKKNAPHAVNDVTFYPAMFSLWIYEVCEKSKRARELYAADNQLSSSGSGFDEDTTMASETTAAHVLAITAQELQQAREIATRLDQLVISPPFDKHADLLQLRGMVGLWIGDLILKENSKPGNEWDQMTEEEVNDATESTSEILQKYSRSRREFEGARDMLVRAQTNGRRVADTIQSAEAKIEDLSRRLAHLGGDI